MRRHYSGEVSKVYTTDNVRSTLVYGVLWFRSFFPDATPTSIGPRRSGKRSERSGPKTDLSGAQRSAAVSRGSKNQVKRERSGRGSRWTGNWAISGLNLHPLHRKTTNIKSLNRFLSYYEIVSVNSLLCCLYCVDDIKTGEGTSFQLCRVMMLSCRNGATENVGVEMRYSQKCKGGKYGSGKSGADRRGGKCRSRLVVW